MAMTLQQRVSACGRDTAFTRTVIGALSKHAKWVIRAEQPEPDTMLADAILDAPDGWAYRFGVAVLTEPAYDATEDADTIPDETIQSTVGELWPLFARRYDQA